MDGNAPPAGGKSLTNIGRARLAAATIVNQRRIGLRVSRRKYLLSLAALLATGGRR